MEYSKDGMRLTEGFEQCRLKAYQDKGGVWTIAWGHTRGVASGLTCCQAQADCWLMEDIGFAEAAVNQLVTAPLSQGEFDALCDFVFNCGARNFQDSHMLALLNEKNYTGAAAEFDRWDHVGGMEVAGLLRRRQAETTEFEGAD